jgi:DNA repair exonuclease SbcCD nuclease subunit
MILVIGDPHFMPGNAIETGLLLENVVVLLEEANIDFVVVLGDVMHDHGRADMRVFVRVKEFIERISNLKPVYVLIGNHDRYSNKVTMSSEHFFGPYERWENVHIVDTDFMTVEWSGKRVCMMPYIPNGMMKQLLRERNLDLTTYDLVFSHSEFADCSMNKLTGSKCDVWEDDYPLNVAGHIHAFESVKHNLVYVGTPFQHTFGESDVNKGVFLVNENLELEFVELDIPKKITIEVDHTELALVEIDPRHHTRLVVNGPAPLIRDLLKSPDYVRKFENVKVVVNSRGKSRVPKFNFESTSSFTKRLDAGLNANPTMKEKFTRFFDWSS